MGTHESEHYLSEDDITDRSTQTTVELPAVLVYCTDQRDSYVDGSAQLCVTLPDGTTRTYDALRQIGLAAVDVQEILPLLPEIEIGATEESPQVA